MGIKLDVDKVLAIAMLIERNGVAFYQAAAARAATPEVRDRLLELADMENEHEGHFAAMKAELGGGLEVEPGAEPLLEALANGHVFDIRRDPESLITGRETPEQIYRTAIALEKEAVVFYTALKKLVPVKAGRARLDDIIQEELGHIVLLGQALQMLRW